MKRLLLVLLLSLVLLAACNGPASAPTRSPTDESKGYFEQGNIYLKQGAWDEAITEFSKAINLNPELEVAARVGRGRANAWAGDFEQALDDFDRAFYINHFNTGIQFYGGSWNSLMNADAYVAWGIAATAEHSSPRGGEAKDLFDSAISLDANNCDAYAGRALWFLQEAYGYGHSEVSTAESIGFSLLCDATSDFEKAIELDPEGIQGRIKRFNFEGDMAFLSNYIEANNLRGAVLVGVSGYRYYDRALEAYDRVLKVAPKNVEALVGQGNAYMALGQNDKAILSFNVALELESYNADACAGRAIAYTKQNQYDLAITDFERAILLDKGYGEGDYDDAYATPGFYDADKENIIGFAPSYIDAYASRGYEFLKQREFTLAISDFTKAIEFQADESNFHHPELDVFSARANRGIAYSRTGAYEKALDDFEIANYGERFEMFTEACIARAIAYWGDGQWEMASRDFAEAEEYDSWVTYMDAQAYVARGGAYLSDIGSGWKDRYWDICMGSDVIQRSFGKAIELDPNNAEAYVGRGIANEIVDENDKAIDDFRIASRIAPGEFEAYVEKYLALIGRDLPTHRYNIAITLDPNDAEAYLGRVLCYVSDGSIIETDSKPFWDVRDDLVFPDLDMALKLNPNLAGAYLVRASIYLEMDRVDEAIADLHKVIESDPTEKELQEALDLLEYWFGK